MSDCLCSRTQRAQLDNRKGCNSATAGDESLAAQATVPRHFCCAGIGFGNRGFHPTGCFGHGFFLMCVVLPIELKMAVQNGMSGAGQTNLYKTCSRWRGKCGAACGGGQGHVTPYQIRVFCQFVNSPPYLTWIVSR